jgi:hypothetical protein
MKISEYDPMPLPLGSELTPEHIEPKTSCPDESLDPVSKADDVFPLDEPLAKSARPDLRVGMRVRHDDGAVGILAAISEHGVTSISFSKGDRRDCLASGLVAIH